MNKIKVSALQRERWVSFNITHDKGFDRNRILEVLYTDLNLNTSVLRAMYFQQYELENNNLLKIFCKTTYEGYQEKLKIYFVNLVDKLNVAYDRDHIDAELLSLSFEEFAWVSNHGANKILIDALLPMASAIVCSLKHTYGDEWGMDVAIEKAIALSVAILSSLEFSREETHHFYHWFFDSRLKTIVIPEGQQDFEKQLTQEIDANYQEQKDMIGYYVDVLFDSFAANNVDFEESWILEWFQVCKETVSRLRDNKESTRIIVPYMYPINESLPYSRQRQEEWVFYGYILECIQNMLGVNFLFELNLLYSLKESTKSNAV